MSEHFINLDCTNCGGKLEVYDDMETFACGYCGSQMLVQRRGGTVGLKAITGAIHKVQIGTDKTAAELAIARLNKELEKLKTDYLGLEANVSSSSGVVGCVVVLVILTALTLLSQAGESPGIRIGMFVFLIGLTIWIATKTVAKNKKRWSQTLTETKSKIDHIEQELARNQKIVQP